MVDHNLFVFQTGYFNKGIYENFPFFLISAKPKDIQEKTLIQC